MNIDTAQLRMLARKADTGTWMSERHKSCHSVFYNPERANRKQKASVCVLMDNRHRSSAGFAEYIAAANPKTVLQLLDATDALALLAFELVSNNQVIEHQQGRINALEAIKIAAENFVKAKDSGASEAAYLKLLVALT